MKKILAIGASNSENSINKIFATHIAHQITITKITVLNWEELELPLYSPDLEQEKGIPENVIHFKKQIEDSDALVISLAEHNGLPTSAFKNLWDWTSRIDAKIWSYKPLFLSATSPGARGGANVLRITKELMPHFGGNVIADFSLPEFHNNFQNGQIIHTEKAKELEEKIKEFQKII